MVNKNEQKVKQTLEMSGTTIIHKGAPDFLCFQLDKQNKMHNIEFIEVKTKEERLTNEQELWKQALETSYCKYRIVRPDRRLWD